MKRLEATLEHLIILACPQVRVAVQTGTVIPIPSQAFATIDYQAASDYKANDEKDTVPKVLLFPSSLCACLMFHHLSDSSIKYLFLSPVLGLELSVGLID